MVPAPIQYQAYPFSNDEWQHVGGSINPTRQGLPGMFGAHQSQDWRAPPTQAWENAQAWQGQLGADLLPLPGGSEMAPNANSHNMQRVVPFSGQRESDSYRNEGWTGMQALPLSMQPFPQANDTPTQLVQVITLPAGAAPPQGAIPVGPLSAVAHETSAVLQMIAVPMGEAPPEGAVPVDQFSLPLASPGGPAPVDSMSVASLSKVSKAFKIKDPSTGRDINTKDAPRDDAVAAPRRLRITNPKTGEEIRPNL